MEPEIPDWREILWKEREGAEGSFVFQIHCEGRWDPSTYTRLFEAMRACCKAHEGNDSIERWIAELFWYLSWWPKQQVDKCWPASTYHQNAVVNFDHLAWWLFAEERRADNQFEETNFEDESPTA